MHIKTRRFKVKIARIFNTFGPRMRVNDGRAIPNFINQALNNKISLFMEMDIKQGHFVTSMIPF